MTTIRVAREDRRRWTTVDRRPVNDSRLSWRARGILVWLLDKPDDWRCDSEAIAREAPEGRDAVRTALGELEECGYLVRARVQDERGRWATETLVHELPVSPAHTDDGFPVVGRPVPGKPTPGSPTAGAPGAIPLPGLIPTTETLARDEPAPVDLDASFEELWTAYPRKVGKGAARKAFDSAVRRAGEDVEAIVAGVARYAEEVRGSEPRFVAHASTWLNGDRWLDAPGANRRGTPPPGGQIDTDRDAPAYADATGEFR